MAGHIVPTDRKQREMNVGGLLNFSICLFVPGHQPTGRCTHTQSESSQL